MNNIEYCVEDEKKCYYFLKTSTTYLLLRLNKKVRQKGILVFSCVFMFETVTVLKLKVTIKSLVFRRKLAKLYQTVTY